MEINLSMKNDDVSTAERSIEYLYEQIGATNLSELQTGFSELIKQQTEIIMLSQMLTQNICSRPLILQLFQN